jgi:NhaP-type Na+/H+ and K+/H+ antiporter
MAALHLPLECEHKKFKNTKISEILTIETLISTPFMLVVSLTAFEFVRTVSMTELMSKNFFIEILPFLKSVVIGVGLGLIVGLFFFRQLRKNSKFVNWILSHPISILVLALLTYLVAEFLEGLGGCAVAFLGIIFGNMYFHKKDFLHEHSTSLTRLLEVLLLIFTGLFISDKIIYNHRLMVDAFVLFLAYLFMKFIAITVIYRKKFDFKHKLFMTFSLSKGISVPIFILLAYTFVSEFVYLSYVLNLAFMFTLYSTLAATIVLHKSSEFLRK